MVWCWEPDYTRIRRLLAFGIVILLLKTAMLISVFTVTDYYLLLIPT